MGKPNIGPDGCSSHRVFDEDCADCVHGHEHQDIARRNQESEDRQAAAFYFKFYHRLSIKPEAVPAMLEALKEIIRNADMEGEDYNPHPVHLREIAEAAVRAATVEERG